MPTLTKKKRYSVSTPPVKPAKKPVPKNVRHMQLYFPIELDIKVQRFMMEENDRRKLAGRENEVHKYIAYPMLVEHGIAFTNHEVYVPSDKLEELLKDKIFRDEYNAMKSAMKAFGRMLSGRLSE